MIRSSLLFVTILAISTAAEAADCCAGSAGIIVSLSGQATLRAPSAAAKPASNLNWLAIGVTVESGAKSNVTIVLTNGRHYQLDEHARAMVAADVLNTLSGSVRELERLPPMPKLAAIAGPHSTLAGSVRVRGGAPLNLYPSAGAAILPGIVKLSFSSVNSATSYAVDLLNEDQDSVWKTRTSAVSVEVPDGIVRAGDKYTWRVRAIGGGAVLGQAEAQFRALSDQDLLDRRNLATALSNATTASVMDESARLALLGAVDFRLGLFAEAVDEFSESLRDTPDPQIERALADAKKAVATGN